MWHRKNLVFREIENKKSEAHGEDIAHVGTTLSIFTKKEKKKEKNR